MGTRLFVGNLGFETSEQTLQDRFTADGLEVVRVRVMTDRETGRPRGFAFVDMATEEEAAAAIALLDGVELNGRRLRVTAAMEREGGGGEHRERATDGSPPRAAARPRGDRRPASRTEDDAPDADLAGSVRGDERHGSSNRGGSRRGRRVDRGSGGRDDDERGRKRGGRRPEPDDDFDDDWE